MNKYQSYKSSGIEWLGDIPSSWGISKIKFCNQIVSSNIDKKEYEGYEKHLIIHYNDVIKNKKIYINNITEFGYCTNTQFQSFKVSKGDIILTKDSMDVKNICDSSIILDDLSNCVFGYHLYKLTSNKEKLNPNYFYHFLNNKNVKNYFLINSNGTTIIGVSKTSLENTPLILPPLHEQHQIVQYLDEKTELIDKLISTKERKITLLKEQRTSLINQVVTKGLNPNVKMKDSCVEWIGEIPENWNFVNFSRICDVRQGLQIPFDDRLSEKVENSLEYITTQSVHNPDQYKQYILNPKPNVICNENDILMGRTGNTGEVVTNVNGVFHNNFFLIDFNRKIINKEFLVWYLTNPRLREELLLLSGTTTIPDLNHGKFLSTKFVYPNLNEQKQIVEFLNSKTKEIDDLVDLEKKKIDLLKEYRQSLISEVVTGKIKVTTDE